MGANAHASGTSGSTSGSRRTVRWAGLVREASAPHYRAFDVFALSSRTEGTPIALFEAMDALVPVVATAVGGVPAVVSAAEALLVPPRPASAAGRCAARRALGSPAARQRAYAARERLLAAYGVGPWLAQYDRIGNASALSATEARSDRPTGSTERPARARRDPTLVTYPCET